AAATFASPRANRFVESVFTAPVERRDWFAAKLLVLLTMAAAYYVALIPMLLVYAHHVGMPPLLLKFLEWTPGLLASSVAVGTLIGVLFIGPSVAGPVATGVGVLLAYAGLVPLQELMVAQANGGGRTGHVALLSPAVLLKNALGFSLAAAFVPASTSRTWAAIALIVVGSLTLAAWVFLRAQGVETWEATRAQRLIITTAIAGLMVVPVLVADANYDRPAPQQNRAPAIRALFARANGNLALTLPNGQPAGRCCGTILNRDTWPISTDTRTDRVLQILLPVEADRVVSDVHVQVTGEFGLHVLVTPEVLAHAGDRLQTRQYPADLGPAMADGRHVSIGWVIAVPVALDPTAPWDIGGDRYPLTASVTYRVSGEPGEKTLTARGAIEAQVGNAIYEMGAAAAILPLFCFMAAFVRWSRTR
ncbi:MAG TPA: hypothetical protein VHZ73_01795, partial [Vicinamibacterales bacterium]|nr:hypothetical protein [Vicinamibacterales bacterium]